MEMNVFLPQDLDARAELLNLSTTKHNIMTSQSTKNIICITQDALLGSYILTRDDKDLGKDKFFDICMKGDDWSTEHILNTLERIKKVCKKHGYTFPLYCGKSLFSMMLPETLNYTKKNDARKDEPVVKIIKGVLVEGALTKANLGQAHNSIIHVLHKEYGMDKAIDFINNTQFIANQFLLHHSFSVGIQDCITDISSKTEDIAYRCFIEAKDTEHTISHERIRELKIGAILDKARDMSMKLAKSKLNSENAFVATVTSGSKGEYFNITQITSMLGQQMHMGQRIQKTLNRGKRTLPHYPKENLTIEQEFESRGFIKHSFLHGLNPQEFIYHAMTGREGCSDTAMKTAASGYIQRKMVKVLEDVQVKYDGTVRNTNGWVVQWAYGGDGFDRSECAFKDDSVFFADVNKIADKINNEFELSQEI
jgi:DNA-directed RNA polymerase II subunit RPB1